MLGETKLPGDPFHKGSLVCHRFNNLLGTQTRSSKSQLQIMVSLWDRALHCQLGPHSYKSTQVTRIHGIGRLDSSRVVGKLRCLDLDKETLTVGSFGFRLVCVCRLSFQRRPAMPLEYCSPVQCLVYCTEPNCQSVSRHSTYPNPCDMITSIVPCLQEQRSLV